MKFSAPPGRDAGLAFEHAARKLSLNCEGDKYEQSVSMIKTSTSARR
jgi:hypothetical protein